MDCHAKGRRSGIRICSSEAPEGFFLTTKRQNDSFKVIVAEHPVGHAVPKTLRLTLVQPAARLNLRFRPTDPVSPFKLLLGRAIR